MASSLLSLADTPRRSPRLAARGVKRSSMISEHVRNTLKGVLLEKNEESSSNPISRVHSFVKETESLSSGLNSVVVTADIGNKLEQFLVVTRKLKSYDNDIGPYDAVRVVVREDSSYRLVVNETPVEINTFVMPVESSCIVSPLSRVADHSWVVCPGI